MTHLVSILGILLEILFVSCIEAMISEFYEGPGKDVYVSRGQNMHLQLLYNPIGNEKVQVGVENINGAADYCGKNPPITGLNCQNATGQVILAKSCVQPNLAGDYEVFVTNGHSLRASFQIHILDIELDVKNTNGKLLYAFPEDCADDEQQSTSNSEIFLRPLNVTIGEEYQYSIKAPIPNVTFISCEKVINGQQKSDSLRASGRDALDYCIQILNADSRHDVHVSCHVVTDSLNIHLRQKLKIVSHEPIDEQHVHPSSCDWGIPTLIGLFLATVVAHAIIIFCKGPCRKKIGRCGQKRCNGLSQEEQQALRNVAKRKALKNRKTRTSSIREVSIVSVLEQE